MKAKDLKNSILQLAIQGKLVPQDPNDEPASKLLEKIRAAKQKLVKEGKIKKDKQESFIYKGDDNNYYEKIGNEVRNITDEIPFEIPDSWEWVRLDSLSNINGGYAFKSSLYTESGIRIIRISDFDENGIKNNRIVRYPYSEDLKPYQLENGNILLAMTGGTVGKSYLVERVSEPMYVNQRVATIKMMKDIDVRYINGVILSGITQQVISYSKNSTNDNISMDTIKGFLIPFPPLAEQKRIVDRIEALDAYVNEYDNAETELSELNETFPEQIKKSILQYAIQGKLVPQNPKDEPASVLLDKIKVEKQRLIKAGKIKKDKVESYIYKRDNRHYEKIGDKEIDITDEIPFEIPDNWAWVRFKNLVHYHMGKTPQRKNEDFWGNGTFPWVSIADLVSDGFLNTTKEKISSHALSHIFKGDFSPKGTLLMSFKLTVGKTSILGINAVHNEAIISIYPYLDTDNIMRNYLFKFMPLLSQDGQTKTAIKGKTLNSDSIDALLIPLPPLNEQKQIISKLEELLKILSCRY